MEIYIVLSIEQSFDNQAVVPNLTTMTESCNHGLVDESCVLLNYGLDAGQLYVKVLRLK